MQLKLLVFILLFQSTNLFSQDYFVTYLKDTTFCTDLEYSYNSRGMMVELIYVNKLGKKIEISKKKNLQNIHVLSISGSITEWMPLKTKKPMSEINY